MPPAGLLSPPPHPRRAGPRNTGSPPGRHRQDFKQAWEAKDIDALIGLLDPDATAIADSGGLVSAQLHPIEGGEQIARACLDVARRAPA